MLGKLFRSRKFVMALAALVVAVGVVAWGWDEASAQASADKVVDTVLVLAGLFIGSTALEDAAAKLLGGGGGAPKDDNAL